MNKITDQETIQKLAKLPPIEKHSKKDKQFFSDIGKALFKSEIKSLISKKNYTLAVIIASTMLDYVGKIQLRWKYNGTISKKEIQNMRLYNVNQMLFASNIIDNITYQRIDCVRRERNNLAHNLLTNLTSFQDEKKLLRVLDDATKSIEQLLSIK